MRRNADPGRLTMGVTSTMGMSQAAAAYRSTNLVVAYEPDRRIAWHRPAGGAAAGLSAGQRPS
jgi:hypothetical protein